MPHRSTHCNPNVQLERSRCNTGCKSSKDSMYFNLWWQSVPVHIKLSKIAPQNEVQMQLLLMHAGTRVACSTSQYLPGAVQNLYGYLGSHQPVYKPMHSIIVLCYKLVMHQDDCRRYKIRR